MVLAACLTCSLSGLAAADDPDAPPPEARGATDIASGRILSWPEFSLLFSFDDHVDVVSGIQSTWSISNTNVPTAFFYAANHPEAEIANAPGLTHISEMTDASALTYEMDSSSSVITVGEFVFLRNPTTGFYGALRFDRLLETRGPQNEADVTWYLQQDGSADFSSFIFSDGFESQDLSYWSSTTP